MEATRQRVYCSAYGCTNSTSIKPNLSFFQVPKDAERRSEWLRLISREDLIGKQPKCYRVCAEHFYEDDILPGAHRKKLKNTALPALQLHGLTRKDSGIQTIIVTHSDQHVQTVDMSNGEKKTADKNIQTAEVLLASTSRVQKLRAELTECRKIIKSNDPILQSKKAKKDTFHKLCDDMLTKELSMIVKANTDLKSHSKGNRYQGDYIIFCLNLYYKNPQAYRLLQSIICMPCPRTLLKNYIPLTTETSERIMLALKRKVETMSEEQRNCSIVVTTINLKANLFYDFNADKIIGFQEIDGLQTTDPAVNALVVIIRGMFTNWNQPIAYALLSEYRNYEHITRWIDGLLEKLFEAGLNIRTFVSDMGCDLTTAKNRSISIEKPYFFVNQRKIFYVFDAPHLIQSVHKNLMLYDFHFSNKVAKYEHILKVYNQDKEKDYSFARKLINNPSDSDKTNVFTAIQVFSNTVATGLSTYIDLNMIDESARDTVELFNLMNNLFDALNSSTLDNENDYKRGFRGEEKQISFFNDMLNFFQELKLINPKNGRLATTNMSFIQGFQITIKSVLLLFEDLKLEGRVSLLTSQLNRDGIKNLFSQFRTKNGTTTEATSRQFILAFRRLLFSNIIKLLKGGSCPNDLGQILIKSEHDEIGSSAAVSGDEAHCEFQISYSDYKEMNMPKKNPLVYVCSFLLRKCDNIHKDCNIFKSYINPASSQPNHNFSTDTRYQRYNSYCNDTSSVLNIAPPDVFVNYVEKMEELLQSTFKKEHINFKILATISKEVKDIDLSPLPCPCFPKTFVAKLFIRMRIYNIIQMNNMAFKRNRNKRKFFNVSSM